MATIENDCSHEALRQGIAEMDDAQLMAQDLVQQGAAHAISSLLQNGCSEENALAMLTSLRESAQIIRVEARRRGKPDLFAQDQVAFNH